MEPLPPGFSTEIPAQPVDAIRITVQMPCGCVTTSDIPIEQFQVTNNDEKEIVSNMLDIGFIVYKIVSGLAKLPHDVLPEDKHERRN